MFGVENVVPSVYFRVAVVFWSNLEKKRKKINTASAKFCVNIFHQ